MKTSKETRIREMASSFEGCTKDVCSKEEVLPALKKLEGEMLAIAFPEKSAWERERMRLQDINHRLDDLSAKQHGKAHEEIEAFKKSSNEVSHMIASEISGCNGEKRMFRRLSFKECASDLVKNLEITDGDYRSEIDGIALTDSAVFILEAKNTRKDVFIDKNGNVYKIGEKPYYDCNLLEKMEPRKAWLSKALVSAGYPDIDIHVIVVYTNDRITVYNCCDYITTCNLEELPSLIEGLRGESVYSSRDIEHMRVALEEMGSRELYPIGFDMDLFKRQFAAAYIKVNEPDGMHARVSARLASFRDKTAARLSSDGLNKARQSMRSHLQGGLVQKPQYATSEIND